MALRIYMFGHLSVPAAFVEAAELDEVELDAEDDAFADGLAVASVSPPPCRSHPVKLPAPRSRWVRAEENL